MAGGMGKGNGIPLGERKNVTYGQLHGSVEGLRRPPGPDPMAPIGETPAAARARRASPTEAATYRDPRPDSPRHVMVATELGPQPGLLVELRQAEAEPWEALVVTMRWVNGQWAAVREWVPADTVTPVGGQP